jgi:hypothetical protein
MSVGKRYVLDANVFIEARQKYYSFDICPGFWLALKRQHAEKRVCSIDKIKAELVAQSDDLKNWTKQDAPGTFFKGTADKSVSDAFRDMVNWVQNEQQFTAEAKAEFSSVADGWIVAYAKANGLVVVTHEEYAPDVRKKVPIPNVCLEFDVEYCNTFAMLRDLNVKFVLKKRQ